MMMINTQNIPVLYSFPSNGDNLLCAEESSDALKHNWILMETIVTNQN